MKSTFLFGIAALAIVASCVPAWSSTLNVGDDNAAAGEPDPIGGTIQQTVGPIAFSSSTFTGTLTSMVITGDTSNPNSGGVTFVYILHNDSTSSGPMDRLTINGYTGFLTDTSYQTPATNQIPSLTTRDTADVVGFSFINHIGPPINFGNGVLSPGGTSAWLVVQTNAHAWTNTTAAIIDGSSADNVASLAPAPGGGGGTPEPSSLMIAGGAVTGLLIRRRRRSV